jgi:hypothetical protein
MAQTESNSEKELELLSQHHPEYVNRFRIAHSPLDFVLDFECNTPGESVPSVVGRMVTSPQGAKLLLNALADNIARYEAAYGEIVLASSSNLADNLFHPNPNKPNKPE